MNNAILVPLDFSDYSLRAFDVALVIAKKLNLEIIALNVYDSAIPPGVNYIAYQTTLEVEEKKSLEKLTDFVVANQSHQYENGTFIPVKAISAKGHPSEVILKIAQEEDTSIIAMGTRGEKGLLAKLIGSVALEVVENAHCPVLIVPNESIFLGIEKMLFAAPLSQQDDKLINILLNFADSFNAHLACLHISLGFADYEKDKERMAFLEEQFALISKKQLIFKHIVKELELDLAEQLKVEVENDNVDLLIMLPQDRGFFKEILHASLTKKMTKLANIPILALKG